jgi:hypothetical protein
MHRTLLMLLLILIGCDNAEQVHSIEPKAAPAELPKTAADAMQKNQLSMLIDGVEWRFDSELMGGINPISDKPEMLISGSRGSNDASEQTFTVIIHGANAPGTYRVKSGDGSQSNFQISGISAQEFLAGNMMPFDLNVIVTEVGEHPMRLRASFEGSIDTNTGRTLRISRGIINYQE